MKVGIGVGKASSWANQNRFWLIGLGLMVASSGLDGAYLAKLMGWCGYLLNSTVDLASEVIMHEYESLRRNNSRKSKQYRHAQWLLVPEAALVFFSWFLSWRQLLLVMPLVEGHATGWVAPIVALFVPVALAATGYAQALVVAKEDADGAGEKATGDQVAVKPKASGIRPRATVDDWRQIVAGLNGQRRSLDATGVQRLLEEHGFGPAAATTARRWAREVANER